MILRREHQSDRLDRNARRLKTRQTCIENMYWNEMKEKMSIKICQLTENKTLLKSSNYSSCNKGSIPTRE